MKKLLAWLFITSVICTLTIGCKSDPVSSSAPEDPDPPSEENVSDADGNVYHTVQIGNQIWTVEDLRTTKYNDGSAILNISDDQTWDTTSDAAYCSYKNQTDNESIITYGLLYNWYAVNTGKLAPEGWHVPSINDWNTLINYLNTNGYNWDGSMTGEKSAKALASSNYWRSSANPGAIGNDLSANNKSGFTAQPVGSRYVNGVFGNRGLMGHWWSSSTAPASYVYSIFLSYELEGIRIHNQQKNKGFAVRLIRND